MAMASNMRDNNRSSLPFGVRMPGRWIIKVGRRQYRRKVERGRVGDGLLEEGEGHDESKFLIFN